MSVNEMSGLGVDINENEVVKYPITKKTNWNLRKRDGTVIMP
jgi:mannonate dehydratase